MADTVQSSSALNIELGFVDGDTRTLSIADPKTNINLGTAAANLGNLVKANNLLIGDKEGAASSGIKGTKLVTNKTTKLDLT